MFIQYFVDILSCHYTMIALRLHAIRFLLWLFIPFGVRAAATRRVCVPNAGKVSTKVKHFDVKVSTKVKHFDGKVSTKVKHFDAKVSKKGKHVDGKVSTKVKHFDGNVSKSVKHFDPKTDPKRYPKSFKIDVGKQKRKMVQNGGQRAPKRKHK